MSVQRVSLDQVQGTLLITLYAKALDYHAGRSILHDSTASDIFERVAVDFSKYRGLVDTSVLRARQPDDWTRAFIRDNPRGTVVSLGSGLDARAVRIGVPESVDWYDVDYPDAIDLRRRLLPPGANRHTIAASIAGDSWIEQIPDDRPTLIVAEGVLQYLDSADVKVLMRRLLDRFARGR